MTISDVTYNHIDSWTTITDSQGTILQELSYDAWGNLRNPTTWSGSFTGTPLIDRGFTGHEHLYGFGLINMNGRMYDPVMSSFLSVDSYVQDPENSQNFNRYAYCFNNPLRYTDPSGEFALIDDIVIAAVFGAIINGWIQGATGNINGIGDCSRALIGGAVTGAMGCGLSVVGGAGMSFGANLALGTVEGGATAAVGEWISGGDGEDILKAAAIGAAIGAITTTITSENLHNALHKRGFKTNANVFKDYKAGLHTTEGGCWQQEAIDYFGFDATYDDNTLLTTSTRRVFNKDGALIDQKIMLRYDAFESYDAFLSSYFGKEYFHYQRKIWEKATLLDEYAEYPTEVTAQWVNAPEERLGAIHQYMNNGLYPKDNYNYLNVIKAEENLIKKYTTYQFKPFVKKWWHFVYKIPRRY